MNAQTITQVIAGYAALVGTASLGWNVYLGLRDRGQLDIRASVREARQIAPGFPLIHSVVYVSVSNRGRRPLTLTHAAWQNRNGKFAIFMYDAKRGPQFSMETQAFWSASTPTWPQTLTESQQLSFYWPLEAFQKAQPKAIVLYDSHDQQHRLGRIAMWKLLRAIRRAPTEDKPG